MRTLGLIPARGGSKGVPGKNIRMIANKPLIAWTIEAALASTCLGRLIVTTEDEAIAAVAQSYGAEVPFMRPMELAQDDTPTLPVVLHALDVLEQSGDIYDAVCLLQPTNPLRNAQDIEDAYALLCSQKTDSVLSFVKVNDNHPARMKYIDGNNRITNPPFAELFEGQPRQMLPELYLRDGSIYLTRVPVLREQRSFQGRDCVALIIPDERHCNIDSEMDFRIAQFLLTQAI